MNRIWILALLAVAALVSLLTFKPAVPQHEIPQLTETLPTAQSARTQSGEVSVAALEAPLQGLDEYIQKVMRDWEVPGLAIAVVKDDKIVLAKGFGTQEIGGETPVDEHTLFAIGSSTKAFTAAALAMLVDEGKLTWDDKVTDYLPDFQLFDPWVTREMTIRDLLTHRSGLERGDLLWYGSSYDRDEILHRIRYLEPSWGFRSRFGYQNIMFLAAGQIIAKVSEMSWDEFVKERIFAPLGMTSSNTSMTDLQDVENVAMPHAKLGDKVESIPYRDIDNIGPAGSINSNVMDMAQWLRLQLSEGIYQGKPLLTPTRIQEMHTPQMVLSPSPYPDPLNTGSHFNTYGLGWFVQDYQGEKVVQHGGNIDGMSAMVAMIPEKKLGLVILTNMDGSPVGNLLMYRVFDGYLNASPRDWSTDFLEMVKGYQQQMTALQKQQEESRATDTKPSLSPEKYVGTYTSKTYGQINVTEEDGKLMLDSPDLLFAGDLEHWHYDTFRLVFYDRVLASSGNWLATFTLNSAAEVAQVTLQNLLLGEFEFERQPEAAAKSSFKQSEILWDTWGVPHIFANDAKGLFYAFGWAQMQSHGDLILRLYGQARGQAAEYWGESYWESDRWVRFNGIPGRAHEWYMQQSPRFRGYLAAFVAGMNDYAKEHAGQIADDVEVVLPVNETDILAHAGRVFHFFATLNGYAGGVPAESVIKQWLSSSSEVSQVYDDVSIGSNAWAIAPSRSENGHAMLVANPHLPWSDFFLWYEAQLTSPSYDAYGAALVGFPVLLIAFNDHLGWTHTVNALDASDLYELTLAEGGYRLDGQVRPFETETETMKVKQADGSMREEALTVRCSIHGPVLAEKDGKALALRVIGGEVSASLEEWWDLGRAKSLSEFEAALKRLQIPFLTVMYADRDGHIMHFFNGRVPVRSQGDTKYWSGVIPGDTSATLWTRFFRYRDLPKVLDPPSGWLENANDPPWATTLPPALNPDDYPPYMSPRLMNFRAQRLAHMLMEDDHISFEELLAEKYSTHMELADRILDDLIPAARQYGSEFAKQAADVLEAWDRQTDADSRGAVLFFFWVQEMKPVDTMASNFFATPWDEKNPITTPDDLADPPGAVAALEAAATKTLSDLGALDVAWGDVMRLRYGPRDYPGNGGPGDPEGIVRVIRYAPASDGRFQSVAGDSYFAAIEFSTPVRAQALLMYGNASQPGSPHAGDQLELAARKEMRPVWRIREEIEAHLEFREVLK